MRFPSFERKESLPLNNADGFKIMSLNFFSLLGRLGQLNILIEEEKPHVIGINETKIDSSISDTDIQIEAGDMRWFAEMEINGMVVLHCTSMKAYQLTDYAVRSDLMHYRFESLSIQIKLGNFRPFLITAIYLLDISLDVFQEFESFVNAIDKEIK